MGQIVKAIQGITEASKILNYPVVSGNVSLYNETDGNAIKPTPTIGGVGLIKDIANRSSVNFKSEDDEIYLIGDTLGYLGCSIYENEILKIKSGSNPPEVDLNKEKKNSDFICELIQRGVIRSCHDISDGGLFMTLFEKCNRNLSFDVDFSCLDDFKNFSIDQVLFSEDQARFVVTVEKSSIDRFIKKAQESEIKILKIGKVNSGNLKIKKFNDLEEDFEINTFRLKEVSENFLENIMK
jgi:phosphoribosylformylglycinamidine synthase subunit PurL